MLCSSIILTVFCNGCFNCIAFHHVSFLPSCCSLIQPSQRVPRVHVRSTNSIQFSIVKSPHKKTTHHKQHRIDSTQFDPINHDGEELLQPPTCGGDTIAVRGSSGSSSFIIVVTAINGSRGIFDLFTFINNTIEANK